MAAARSSSAELGDCAAMEQRLLDQVARADLPGTPAASRSSIDVLARPSHTHDADGPPRPRPRAWMGRGKTRAPKCSEGLAA